MNIIDRLFYTTKTIEVKDGYGRDERRSTRSVKELSHLKAGFIIALVVLTPFFVLWTVPFRSVPANTVAIKYNKMTGRASRDQVYREGLHWVGFWGDFHKFPTTIQEFDFSYGTDEYEIEDCTECVWTRTTDGLQVILEAWVQYRIQPDKLIDIFNKHTTFGELESRLFSVVRTTINDVVSGHEGIYVYSHRTEIIEKTKGVLRTRLAEYSITLVEFGWRNIDFPDAFEQAQLQKRVAQEAIETADFVRQKSIIEVQQKIIIAAGDANVSITLAIGQAESAFKVREQMNMTNAEYLQWLYLQQLANLDSPQIIIVTGDEVPEFLIPIKDE